jgi:multimeric flavodoxin WrbA
MLLSGDSSIGDRVSGGLTEREEELIKRLEDIETEQKKIADELRNILGQRIQSGLIKLGSEIPEIKTLEQFLKFEGVDEKLQRLECNAQDKTFYKYPGIYEHSGTGGFNVLGISTTSTEPHQSPTRSTSEHSLIYALDYARRQHKSNVAMIRLRDLPFGSCEGWYSSNKAGCQWPCEVSRREWYGPNKEKDQLDVVYYGLTEWADIIILATPIRYNNPSALYYKMAERLNTVHNHVTLQNKTLIRDKVSCFIITGGQDGVQSVAGHLLTYWSEMGFYFPRFSYVGWNRGWYAEDTSQNYFETMTNEEFELDIEAMVDSAIDLKERLRLTSDKYPKYDRDEFYIKKYENRGKKFKEYDPSSRRLSKKFRTIARRR